MERMNYRESDLSAEAFENYGDPFGALVEDIDNNDYYAYINAATCPDCESGMVRVGSCLSCPSCGFGSCSV